MKSTASAGLLGRFHLAECIGYVLSLPVHCLALGCTTVGQVEDGIRVAQQVRERASGVAGPRLEEWKRDAARRAAARRHADS